MVKVWHIKCSCRWRYDTSTVHVFCKCLGPSPWVTFPQKKVKVCRLTVHTHVLCRSLRRSPWVSFSLVSKDGDCVVL
jgi:hypothetical protein